jgi:hypothetical protein
MTNRIRMGLAITMILGVIYAASALMVSLQQVAVGMIVAAVAALLYGLCDYIEFHHDDRIAQTRMDVWARRDAESRRGL